MNNRLILFGDSFVNMVVQDIVPWWQLLAKRLKRVPIRYGNSGVSRSFLYREFCQYRQHDHNPDDRIIWVQPVFGRAPTNHPDFPPEWANKMAPFYSRDTFFKNKNNSHLPQHFPQAVSEHYTKHQGFYQDLDLLGDWENTQQYFVYSTLASLPNPVTIIETNSLKQTRLEWQTSQFELPLPENSRMFQHIKSQPLGNIAHQELEPYTIHDLFNLYGHEPRTCHLGRTNNQRLCNAIHQVIRTGDPSSFEHCVFRTGLNPRKQENRREWSRINGQRIDENEFRPQHFRTP